MTYVYDKNMPAWRVEHLRSMGVRINHYPEPSYTSQREREKTWRCVTSTLTCCKIHKAATASGFVAGTALGFTANYVHPMIGLASALCFCCGLVNCCCCIKEEYHARAQKPKENATEAPVVSQQPQQGVSLSSIKEEFVVLHDESNHAIKQVSTTGKRNYVVTKGSVDIKADGVGGKPEIKCTVKADGVIKLLSYNGKAINDANSQKMMKKAMKNKQKFRNAYVGGMPMCDALTAGYWR